MGWDICVVQLDTLHFHQSHEQGHFNKKWCLFVVGRTIWDGSKLQPSNQNLTILNFFNKTCSYDVAQSKPDNREFFQWVFFEFIDSFKKQRCKVPFNLWRSMWKKINSKAFVDTAIAGKHRGLSTYHTEHNLFHQSKPGQHVELQNTHNASFNFSRDLMRVSTLSAQWPSDQS